MRKIFNYRMTKSNNRVLSVLLCVIVTCSCANIKEVGIMKANNVHDKPIVSAIADSLRLRQVKSAIQSSPAALLANSMEYNDGKWSMALTKEDADSLGVPRSLYEQYLLKIEELNK